jgi:hypothetical protein
LIIEEKNSKNLKPSKNQLTSLIWTACIKPDRLLLTKGFDLLAFIFELFAKIWYFFSFYKLEKAEKS